MQGDVLVLNAAYMPLRIINWQDAICLWYTNKAEILESYDDKMLRSWSSCMQMPAVIRLYKFIRPHKNMKFYWPFTRKNVFLRDHGKCQYCGQKVSLGNFTFDHVIPQSKGGITYWTNIVCACQACNSKKGNKMLAESGMKLIQKPYAPILAEDFQSNIINQLGQAIKMIDNKHWLNYCYWNLELDSN